MAKKNRDNSSKYKSIRKSRNKIVKILAKSKIWNLLKLRSRNLSKFKNSIKIQNDSIIRIANFLTLNAKVTFVKLKKVLT